MLIQIAFILLMLFGVAALTVDLGIARLTQVQMQSAADTAALEGLRNSRMAACQAAAWTFTDTYQDPCGPSGPSGPSSTDVRLGAGPEFAMTDSGLALNASQTIDVAASGTYQPVLQFNPVNAPNGDMVGGTFQATSGSDLASTGTAVTSATHSFTMADVGHDLAISGPGWTLGTYTIQSTTAGAATLSGTVCASPPCSSGVWVESGPFEDSDYQRTDFAAGVGTSFLVRLRRTDPDPRLDPDNLNRDTDATDPSQGVSSSGGSLPFLFGRSLPMHGDPASTYDPRVHGMTVRATAIANGQPALRVGPASAAVTPPLPGWGSVAVERGAWMTLLPHDGSSIELTLGSGGVLTFGGTPVGQAIQAPGAITVGDRIMGAGAVIAPQCGLPPVPDACGSPVMGMNAYVPVYDSVSNLVTGFGFASVCEIPGTPALVTIAPVNGHIACANATALVPGGLSGPIANLGQTSLFVPAIVR